MARTLNSGDALYSNITFLLGVDDDGVTVKDFKTPSRTVTLETGVTVQSGNYGFDFKVLRGVNYSVGKGVLLSPDVSVAGATVSGIVVFQELTNLDGSYCLTENSTGGSGAPAIAFTSGRAIRFTKGLTGNQSIVPATTFSAVERGTVGFSFTQNGTIALYKNGVLLGTDSDNGSGTSCSFNKFGYYGAGNGSIGGRIAYIVYFNTALTTADHLRLYNSLGAGGTPSAFSLLTTATGANDSGSGALTSQRPVLSGAGTVVTTPRFAEIILVNTAGTPQASLSGLKWAWFDQVTPNLFTTGPTDKGAAGTTDGSGKFRVQIVNTSKQIGQVGWLTVTNSDGVPATVHKAFCGPTTVVA